MHRTSTNQSAVFQMLDHKFDFLIHTSMPSSCGVEDNLLCLQTLLLYQIIRIFDGDIRQRANAERQLDVLDACTLRLHGSYFEAERTQPSQSYYLWWIILESVRRTIMMSVFLRDLHGAMQNAGALMLLPLLSTLPVASNTGLWNEFGPPEGTSGISEQYLLSYSEFTHAWNAGGVRDPDNYHKTLLIACRFANGTGQFKI